MHPPHIFAHPTVPHFHASSAHANQTAAQLQQSSTCAHPDAFGYLSGLSSRQHPALSKPLTALIPSQSSTMPPDVPVRGAITRSPTRGALQVLAVHCLTLPKPAPAEPVMPCGGALPAAIGFAVALANIVRAVPQARARARKRCQFPTRVV